LRQCLSSSKLHHHDYANGRQRQQQSHFDIQSRAIQRATNMPLIALIAINREPEEQRSKTIVEASQHENAMQPL